MAGANRHFPIERAPLPEPGQAGAEMLQHGMSLQRVQTQYTAALAVQKPRVLASVERQVMAEAALLGDDGFYAWGAGKDRIEGPSKHLAIVLARCWGNCAIEMAPVVETPNAYIFTAIFVDHETGFSLPRQFRQSRRWAVHGRFDEERKEDIRFQIGQSKAQRNAILNALPQWLIARAMDQCRGGVRAKVEARIKKDGLAAVQNAALARLEALGVASGRVLAAFGRHAPTALTLEDLVTLSGSIRAIETGIDTADSMFPVPDVRTEPDAVADELHRKVAKAAGAAQDQRTQDDAEPA